MNKPPAEFVRVSADKLQSFIEKCLKAVGLATDHAELMGKLLTDCDLRGVHSHGVNRLPMYANDLKEGRSNPNPNIRVVKQEKSFVIIDGDGGIGYLPTVQATQIAIKIAKENGLGAGVVKHICHYGAAGIYTRMCAEAGCIGFSVQGNLPNTSGNAHICFAFGSPPMSFAFPAFSGPPVVLDFSTTFFSEKDLDLFERIPSVFFKSLGLTLSAKLLGGVLVGQMLKEGREIQERYPSHAGGGFILAININDFVPEDTFMKEIDRLHRDIGLHMKPMPGYDRPLLPGAVESELEETYRQKGIPINLEIKQRVETGVKDLNIPFPW
jgi:ureidoglycolate dehydrogenase (NAD+)